MLTSEDLPRRAAWWPAAGIASLVEQAAAGEFVEIDENRQPTVALDLDAPPAADDTTQVPRRKPRR